MNSITRYDLVTRLHSDPKFGELSSNAESIAYLLENFYSFDQLKEQIQANINNAWSSSRKSSSLASRYYQEADICFKTERYTAALKAVHKAIQYTSPSHKSAFARLYAHKWRIHSCTKDYDAMLYTAEVCLDLQPRFKYLIMKILSLTLLREFSAAIDLIDQVIGGGQTLGDFKLESKLKKSKLAEVKAKILSNVKNEESTRFQKPSEQYFSHKLSPKVKIVNSPVVGRHFVATQTIPRNVVILQERAYSLVLELDYWKIKCANCNHNLGHKFFPCAYCTEPLFCDRACFQAAYQNYHRYECGLASLARTQMTMSAAHVFRIFSRMGPLNAFDVEEETSGNYSIDQYLAEFNDDVDVPEEQWTQSQKENKYRMSSILWHHNEKHNSYFNAQHTVVAVEVAVLLDIIHNFRKRRPSHDFLLAFVSCILVNMRRITFNVFGWHEYGIDDDWSARGHVANCQCLVGSLINHSCECNVSWEWKNGIITFTTKRIISAGEQITITYGPGKSMEHYKRQERLNYYFFACNCNLCLKDAKSGNNLRCRRCDGPVVYGSAQNKEPQLNGKCITCFEKYENFEESVKLLTEVKKAIHDLTTLTAVFQSENILKKATKLLADLIDLSLPESEPICQSVLLCSLIIERNSRFLFDEGQKLKLALLFDRALPPNIPKHLLDKKCLCLLKFWLSVLNEKIVRSVGVLVDEQEKEQLNRYWETANRIKRRLLSGLETISKEGKIADMLVNQL